MPVAPVAPGGAPILPPPGAPLRPAAATPGAPPAALGSKSGTAVIKSAPPKETARITVKPSLPPAAPVRPPGAPVEEAAAAGAAVGAAAAAAPKTVTKGGKPATTIVKTGTTKFTPPATKATAAAAPGAPVSNVPVETMTYEEAPSTVMTTSLAAVLALTTWGCFGWLLASYMGWV
jgi:hypothetical protein